MSQKLNYMKKYFMKLHVNKFIGSLSSNIFSLLSKIQFNYDIELWY